MYNVLVDETTLQPKHLQMLSYKLAHMYFNLSVSGRSLWPRNVFLTSCSSEL